MDQDNMSQGIAELCMPMADNPLLRVQGLGISYGHRRVLADLDFVLPASGVTVLMGPAGTGKSTLLHLLSGLPPPARRRHVGTVIYLGKPIAQGTAQPAFVQQRAQDLAVRLGDLLASGLREHMTATPSELRSETIRRLSRLGLEWLTATLDERVADLSPVGVRLAGVLRAAFSDRPLLLIDEPTHGLRDDDADKLLALIQRLGRERACLVTTHNQRHARAIADHAMLIAGGRIQANAPAQRFFSNPDQHPVLAQFLRTGSCSVPSLDAPSESLCDDATQAPPGALAEARPVAAVLTAPTPASAAPAPAPAVAGELQQTIEEPEATLLPSNASIQPTPDAAPNSLGPAGFHWLIPGRLAGCPKPGVIHPVDHDLKLLRRMGITLLVNLTEHPFPAEPLARHGLKGFAVRIEDRRAPPLLWAKLLLAKMHRFMLDGENVAVHCLAGLGRTGTILCGWLIKEGLTAEEALRRLRSLDPGFVQSEEQEQLLRDLENNLLIRAN